MSRILQIVIDMDIEANDKVMRDILQYEVDYFIDRLENSMGIYSLTTNEDIIKEVDC